MSGNGNLLAEIAPMALMAIPGVGEALAPAIEGLGMGEAGADALSTGLIGALTSGGISALTGGKNPLRSALIGGVGAGLGNFALGPAGFGSAADTASTAASGLSGANATASDIGTSLGGGASGATAPLSDVGSQFASGLGGSGSSSLGNLNLPVDAGGGIANAGMAVPVPQGGFLGQGATSVASPAAPSSMAGNIGQWISKNPLQAALMGSAGLSAIQSLTPHPQVNVGQNAANVMASNPNFSNATLPPYHIQNTATPYSGNWYTYGMTPQQPLYNGQLMQGAKRGGLMKHYAHGGRVHGYAAGGMPMPSPMQPPQATPQLPVNPLMIKVAHNVGIAIGKHLKNKTTPDGQVRGPGGGQDDAIPAKLSQDEFIIPADVTSALGDGSSNAGAKALHGLIKNVRAQKATKGFPPKAHNPLSYLPKKGKA